MRRRAVRERDLLLTIQFATLELNLHNLIRALSLAALISKPQDLPLARSLPIAPV